jgi:hypothetical protein
VRAADARAQKLAVTKAVKAATKRQHTHDSHLLARVLKRVREDRAKKVAAAWSNGQSTGYSSGHADGYSSGSSDGYANGVADCTIWNAVTNTWC